MPPVLSQTGSTALDQIPPVGYIKMSANKQHRLHCTNINTMVWRMCILNWGYNDILLAWIWHILPEFHGIFTINLLKLLAPETSIYLTTQ